MKIICWVIGFISFSSITAQNEICNLNNFNFKPETEAFYTYRIPVDTTDQLISSTYLSITADTIYYADILRYRTECISLIIIKVALKDLKHDGGSTVEEIIMDEKKKTIAYRLTLFTSIGNNVFYNFQTSKTYGTSDVRGNIMNIVCEKKEQADKLAAEINTRVNMK